MYMIYVFTFLGGLILLTIGFSRFLTMKLYG